LKSEGFEPLNVMGGMEAWESAGYDMQL
jgi:hypothetical protein